MSEEEQKYQAVKQELVGLDVQYSSHRDNGQINMAKINGFSIIWHEYAYCAGERGTVEVMKPDSGDDNIDGHYPISKLRELVNGK